MRDLTEKKFFLFYSHIYTIKGKIHIWLLKLDFFFPENYSDITSSYKKFYIAPTMHKKDQNQSTTIYY